MISCQDIEPPEILANILNSHESIYYFLSRRIKFQTLVVFSFMKLRSAISVTKEKSAFEKLTNDLKRFSKRGKSPTRNSVESSTSSMCSPTSAPEKSGLTFYIDADASLKEDELSANQKKDSVWALTASSSVKRKSFRKPSRLDRSVHEKRFTSSVRDCSRRNASHKDISTRHSALVVASPIKEPSTETGKPKNSKVIYLFSLTFWILEQDLGSLIPGIRCRNHGLACKLLDYYKRRLFFGLLASF